MAVKIVTRSPRYPVIGLREAITKVSEVYNKDRRNKIPKSLVAEHLGYSGLNGASLGIISAINKYGLLEGGADSMGVTERALVILMHQKGDPERVKAIADGAREPDLFRALDEAFPATASDAALRAFLVTKREFLPDSADRLIRSYRETQELVEEEGAGYDSPKDAAAPQESASVLTTAETTAPLKIGAMLGIKDVADSERELTTGMLSKGSSFRLVVTGTVGVKEIERLIRKLELDKEILADADDEHLEPL